MILFRNHWTTSSLLHKMMVSHVSKSLLKVFLFLIWWCFVLHDWYHKHTTIIHSVSHLVSMYLAQGTGSHASPVILMNLKKTQWIMYVNQCVIYFLTFSMGDNFKWGFSVKHCRAKCKGEFQGFNFANIMRRSFIDKCILLIIETCLCTMQIDIVEIFNCDLFSKVC